MARATLGTPAASALHRLAALAFLCHSRPLMVVAALRGRSPPAPVGGSAPEKLEGTPAPRCRNVVLLSPSREGPNSPFRQNTCPPTPASSPINHPLHTTIRAPRSKLLTCARSRCCYNRPMRLTATTRLPNTPCQRDGFFPRTTPRYEQPNRNASSSSSFSGRTSESKDGNSAAPFPHHATA